MDLLDVNSSMSSASSVWMRFRTHLPTSFFVAHQRATGPEHRYGAPKGPAALAVYPPPPFVSARQRFSRDPPIATLPGSHALPTSGVECTADIQEGQLCSFPLLHSTPTTLTRGATTYHPTEKPSN